MAAVIVCDKCGMTGIATSKFMHVRAYEMSSATAFRTTTINQIDVCKECYDKIFKNKSLDKEENTNGN